MTAGRLAAAVSIAAVALFHGRADAQDRHRCDPELAEKSGLTVERVHRIGSRYDGPVPVEPGATFSREALRTAQAAIQQALDKKAVREGPVRFRLAAATVTCDSMDEAARTVTVEVRIDHVIVSQGNTAGEVVDEASRFQMAGTQTFPRVTARIDHDARLGTVVGIGEEDRSTELAPNRETPSGEIVPVALSGWKSLTDEFFSVSATGAVIGDPNNHSARGLHLVVPQRYWWEHVPFANGTQTSKGLGLGFGGDWQLGGADLRGSGGIRWLSIGLTSPTATVESHQEFAVEGNFQQELTNRAGFFRFGGWGDHSFASLNGFSRAGAFARIYEDFSIAGNSSWGIDLMASTGRSGEVPIYRMFTGGNRLDPFLADRSYPGSEFAHPGPMLRGYGESAFAFPLRDGKAGGMRYDGVSATLSLPGFSLPLLEAVDDDRRPRIDRLIQDAFDASVSNVMTDEMRDGMSADNARQRSRREGLELRKVLQNIFAHGHRFSMRPLLLLDSARLVEQTTLRATTIGAGLRITGLSAGAELLYTQNFSAGPSDPIPSDRQLIVRLFFRSGVKR